MQPTQPTTPDTSGPQRTCIVCRSTQPSQSLQRLVRSGDTGAVGVAAPGAPGRGAWICVDQCAAQLTARQLSKALRTRISDTAAADLRQLLTQSQPHRPNTD